MTVRQRSHKRIFSGVCAAILIGLTGCSQKTSDEHLQAAQAFMDDPEYMPHLKARTAGSVSHHYLIEAKDDLA